MSLMCTFSIAKCPWIIFRPESTSLEVLPAIIASTGCRRSAYPFKILPKTLYEPVNQRRPWTDLGVSTADKADMQFGLARKVPFNHTHPRIVAVCGQIIVLWAERVELLSFKVTRTQDQFLAASSGVLPPQ